MGKPEHVERKLAAILAADIVGYSRLMGADEVGTLRALKAARKEQVDPTIAAYGGRIVKTTGDGLLADFQSVVEAVACAVTIQRRMIERNNGIADEKRIVFRLGINIGDIIIDGDDIFGDGVNIAARLESICEPGGLCISDTACDQVRDKLPLTFADRGEQQVKNITRPVRVFALSPHAIVEAPELSPGRVAAAKSRKRPILAGLVALALGVAGAAAWWTMYHGTPLAPQTASAPRSASTDVRPSIAVLPLVSLADATNEDYFADGLTEDVISAVGRFSEFVVRSRNAVFSYKGKNPRPEDVGRDLDVRYIVEGSIRRSPERIRISIRLTDATRGALLWSENYDVAPKDIFSVQDDITRRIAGTLASRLSNLELAKIATKPPSSLEAYDIVLRGRDLLSRVNRSANSQARALFNRAIELDPGYAPAYVGLGRVELYGVLQGWTADPEAALQRAENLGQKAVAIDSTSAGAHALLGSIYIRYADYDRALDEMRRAVELNNSDPDAYAGLATALLWAGDVDAAVKAFEAAVTLAAELLKDLKRTQFMDIGEFGRPVHAEMAALIDAARRGVAVDGHSLYVTAFPCHNCAKHIIAAGISRVIYLEPYPKSRADLLHGDELELESTVGNEVPNKVVFYAFSGIAPRQYRQLFGMTERGKDKGLRLKDWENSKETLTPPYIPASSVHAYLAAEQEVLKGLPPEIYSWSE